MKHITEFGIGAAMLLTCTGTLFADPPTDPQSQVSFETGSSGTWNVDWEGVVGRVYFIQWSIDLLQWDYLPVIEAGEDISSFGATSSSDKFFLRLHYANFDPQDPDYLDAENADYDNDGLSNLFEVMNGFNPFVADLAADPDEDGLNNVNEQTAGTNPKSKDNPAVKLSVVVTGD